MGAIEGGVMRRIWAKIEILIEHIIRKGDQRRNHFHGVAGIPSCHPSQLSLSMKGSEKQRSAPENTPLNRTLSSAYQHDSKQILIYVLYSGEFVLYTTLWRIIHSNAIISLKISPTLCVCGYHILIEPVITPNCNSIHFDCRPSLKPTKVWTLWRPMPLRDRAPLLDVCRKKVNND